MSRPTDVIPKLNIEEIGQGRNLELLRMDEDSSRLCEALFFSLSRKYHSLLAARRGCDLDRMSKAVQWSPYGEMVVKGLFAAGSALNPPEIKATAASDGLKAAKEANDWLLEADQSSLAVKPVSWSGRAVRQTNAVQGRWPTDFPQCS